MGLLSGLLGLASDVDVESLEKEFEEILVAGEQIEKAYKLVRDLIVFTNKRLIFVDKQGVTGKKREVHSVPYTSITHFSKETAGHFELDSDLIIWIRGQAQPIVREFRKDKSIHEIYRVLGAYVLR